MPVELRKLVVVLHIISSVSWLGLTIGNLVLTITGATTDNPTTQHAAYRVMGILGDALFIPISVTAFVTGTLLGLFTSWGLFQHRWVAVKFWLTLIAVVLTPLSLLPGIHDAVAAVSRTPPDQLADVDPNGAISAGCVSLTMYTTSVLLSIFKPWGRTTLGRHNTARQAERGAARRAKQALGRRDERAYPGQ
jgi:uncharacterized membrane protein